jgi:rubredoxin
MVTIMCGKCGHVFAEEQLDAASARSIEAARSG